MDETLRVFFFCCTGIPSSAALAFISASATARDLLQQEPELSRDRCFCHVE
jgi:hypothetical protein